MLRIRRPGGLDPAEADQRGRVVGQPQLELDLGADRLERSRRQEQPRLADVGREALDHRLDVVVTELDAEHDRPRGSWSAEIVRSHGSGHPVWPSPVSRSGRDAVKPALPARTIRFWSDRLPAPLSTYRSPRPI